MSRLFVAIDLPLETRQALASIRPSDMPGVRLVDPDQMHVTLHFIGPGDGQRLAARLQPVRSPPFALRIEGVGRFLPRGGGAIFWAGLAPISQLQTLHECVGKALEPTGFRAEARPYCPHVTLARGDGRCTATIAGFLERHAGFVLPAVPITGFSLYASEFVDGKPVYTAVRRFPLG